MTCLHPQIGNSGARAPGSRELGELPRKCRLEGRGSTLTAVHPPAFHAVRITGCWRWLYQVQFVTVAPSLHVSNESPSIDRARVLGRVVRTAECALVSRERWTPPSIAEQHK